ncbi:MAG: DUF1902 domain-containing protein [Gammaproteobacteria bacterium]|nr:DUF1902 domain-containing protein [Gammaproteobacteria bacterium]
MQPHELCVDVRHYVDDDIWIATSDDITGMVVESRGIATFLIDVVDVAVQLLELSDGYDASSIANTNLRLRVNHVSGDDSSNQTPNHPSLRLTELHLAAA